MQPPYTMGTGQFMAPTQVQQQQQQQQYMQQQQQQQQQQFRQPMYGPPTLQQGPRLMGPNQQNMAMNNYGGGVPPAMGPGAPKDDYRKVGTLHC